MQTTLFEPGEPTGRHRLDSNTVARLDEVTGFADLVEAFAAARAAHPDARIVCTLDDLDQCVYTSMHAALRLDDDANWDDGPYDYHDPAAVHRVENARVARIAALLDDPARQVDWANLADTRAATEDDLTALVAANREPDHALDDVVLIQRVPVDRDDFAVAGIPNGYFADDWDIFANHAVIRRMAGHGYQHVAVGASLLGFVRSTPPSVEQAAAVVTDLIHLYGTPESIAWHELALLLPTRRLLLLGYTENFADAIDEIPEDPPTE
ncbi:hypothetical protein BOX37_19760 [Nocardia mangyaensis]|uniref:DUF4253 domain-containing protein n=1 Tax=Nocardia mangyaensis TaxID=2213200 RepID=A0A1J0VUU0_9NOCA|nr:hypothetical protein [Nocardia mangyaensis]APE35813.1 hypothetical protein BOX37_19760 [Nocardia mangyaensis]